MQYSTILRAQVLDFFWYTAKKPVEVISGVPKDSSPCDGDACYIADADMFLLFLSNVY